jgi:DNA-binding NarL/FixJ family response regulator
MEQKTRPIKVLLTDDHTLVRAGIRGLIESLPGVTVVGEAGTGEEALAFVEKQCPDIIMLDIGLPGLNGLDVAERLQTRYPELRVLILSVHSDEEYVRRAVRAGVAGYLLKDASVRDLEAAIGAVMRGETYLSPAISRQVVRGYAERLQRSEAELTPRQEEILKLIAEGFSTKEAAFRLGVSVKTVETHRTQIMERLNVHNIAGLVRYAMRSGLVSPEH